MLIQVVLCIFNSQDQLQLLFKLKKVWAKYFCKFTFLEQLFFIALLMITPLVTDVYFVYKCQFKFFLLAYHKSILCNARKKTGSWIGNRTCSNHPYSWTSIILLRSVFNSYQIHGVLLKSCVHIRNYLF